MSSSIYQTDSNYSSPIPTRSPYAKWFGIEIREIKDQSAIVSMTVEPHHLNTFGVGHGGVCLSLADHACGALLSGIAQGMFFATVTLNSAFFRPVKEGELLAKAQLLSRSKTTAHIEANVIHNDELLFKASGSFAIRAKRSP